MYATTPALWPALAAFLTFTAPLAIADAREHRLPLGLNLSLLGSGAALLAIASIWTGTDHLTWAALSLVLAVGLAIVLFIAARGGLGFGDVILIAGLSLFSGFISPLAMILGIWLGTLVTAGWMLHRRHHGTPGPVPFGPGLILGTLTVLLAPLPGIS